MTTIRISLLSIGSELLDGRTTDTNATFLGSFLDQQNYALRYGFKAADSLPDITEALSHLEALSDVIIVSGGLGPTSDDLTRDAIAEFCGRALELNEEDLLRIKKYYTERKRKFQQSNRKQAFFPDDATILPNHTGTASGFIINHNDTMIISLPGVPREFQELLTQQVLPCLIDRFPPQKLKRKESFRLFDMPESQASGVITGCKLEEDIEVGYRVHFPELEISLSTAHPSTNLNEIKEVLMDRLGREFIYTTNHNMHLPETVHHLLLESGKTLGLAESCTGGRISSYLTDFAGSSEYLKGSAVTYSNEAKMGILSVSADTLSKYGAVSHETVREMATGALKTFRSDIAVSISGIAGPGGGSSEKPVGTYFIGLATENELISRHYFFPATREMVRKKAAYNALDIIRRYFLGLPLSGSASQPSISVT